MLTLKSRFGRQQLPILAVSSPADDGQRKSRRERDDRRDLPSADHLAQHALAEILAAIRSERQVVDDRRHEAVALIEDRRAILARQAVRVLRVQGVGAECANAAAVVGRISRTCRRQEPSARWNNAGSASCRASRSGVADVGRALEQAELRKRRTSTGVEVTGHRLVREVDPPLQVVPLCPR